jgi:hypothetical protein
MPVYVDHQKAKYGRMIMCHMLADSIPELLEMVDKLNLNRRHFQPWSHPHFDISLGYRAKAVEMGAVEVSRKELVGVMKNYRAFVKISNDEREILVAATQASDMWKKRVRDSAELRPRS